MFTSMTRVPVRTATATATGTLERLQRRLGYQFQQLHWLEQALTHRSVDRQANYERLEFVGDAMLGMIVANHLFHVFAGAPEGELTRMRASLVRQASLAQIARELQLPLYLRLGLGERKSGGLQRESILADVVEALIGAMVQDGAPWQQINQVVLAWLTPLMGQVLSQPVLKDPKTRLQEWLQARQQPLPSYHLLHTQGQPPEQIFTVSCQVSGQMPVQARGSSIRHAEQAAASDMLALLASPTAQAN